MKISKVIFSILAIVAVIGIVTGHPWHIGTLAICLVMVAASTEDEEEKKGAGRLVERRCWSARRPG